MNVRPFVDDDAPAVAALTNAEEARFYGRYGIHEEQPASPAAPDLETAR